MWIGSWGACCSIQGKLCCGSYLAICQGTRPYANSVSFGCLTLTLVDIVERRRTLTRRVSHAALDGFVIHLPAYMHRACNRSAEFRLLLWDTCKSRA